MMMSKDRIEHPDFAERLSDYLEGDLSPDEHAALEEHLSRCGPCRELLAEVRAVVAAAGALQPMEPPRDLWQGIAATIQAPAPHIDGGAKVIALPTGATQPTPAHGGQQRGATPAARRYAFSTPQLAAASIALVAASSLATWLAGPGLGGAPPAEPSVPVAGAVSMVSDPAPVPAELADELASLEQTLDEARSILDPNTVRVLERNLAVIEQAIEDSRRALEQDPGNEFLASHLERVYERKLEYLREAARVAEWSD
jgi:anti-sigma factor RsiW